MTIQQAQQQTLLQLKKLYDAREAATMTDWIMEHLTGKKRIDRLIDIKSPLSSSQTEELAVILQQLATHRPIQYVLSEAWFAGSKFFVNEHVLIPRPETEELVLWSLESEVRNQEFEIVGVTVLDIGTGSGCIPVSIKRRMSDWNVIALDISDDALKVARKNATHLDAAVSFIQMDFLDESSWSRLPVFDIIISNPPYIKQSEEKDMAKHVLDFEPSIALFVPDEDALLFYRKIAEFGKTHLYKEGGIFLEINEALGKEVVDLFEQQGYATELRKDLQGKERMVKAVFNK